MYCNKGIRAYVYYLFCDHSQQPHLRDVFLNQKISPIDLDKFINQQEGILAYTVINGPYLLGDILTNRNNYIISNL